MESTVATNFKEKFERQLKMQEIQELTGFPREVILRAYRKRQLRLSRPGGGKSPLYGHPDEIQRWLESIVASDESDDNSKRRDELQAMTRKQLVELCRDNGLKATKGKPDTQLIEFILEAESESAA